MIKLYKYELKRLIFNKFFIALFFITILYSWQVLGGEIIIGIAYTAPFSKWSYGKFLSDISPFFFTTLLFFITYLYSKKEKAVRTLTIVTPISALKYGIIKYFAIFSGFLMIVIVTVLTSFFFYAKIFRFFNFSTFLSPILFTIIPAMLFIMGVGIALGSIHVGFVYCFMVFIFLLTKIPLPYFLDLLGNSFYSNYPLTLPIGDLGEPAFYIPITVLAGKILFSVVGITLIIINLFSYKKKEHL